ncbi:MAG: hypothetical protein LC733_11265, partial [Actinobacteria bacterium]|nr:hypothetical protein [Actinomycetota bacterium]
MRSPVAVIVALALAVLSAGPARAQAEQPVLDRAAAALRAEPVYVDGAAELGQDVDADRLVQRIRQREAPVYIAVLPASAAGEAGGNASAMPQALARKVGLAGTYGVVTGRSFRAGSTNLPTGRAAGLASASFQAHQGEGLQAVLVDFVDRVATTVAGSGNGSGGGQGTPFEGGGEGGDRGGDGGGGGSSVLPLLLLAGAGGGGFYLWQKGKRRRQEEALQDEADWSLLRAEVSV